MSLFQWVHAYVVVFPARVAAIFGRIFNWDSWIFHVSKHFLANGIFRHKSLVNDWSETSTGQWDFDHLWKRIKVSRLKDPNLSWHRHKHIYIYMYIYIWIATGHSESPQNAPFYAKVLSRYVNYHQVGSTWNICKPRCMLELQDSTQKKTWNTN